METGTRKAYTVSQINSYIKNMFLSDYALNHIYIKGEVSNCKYHSSGHIYFTLKDEKSQIACVMFAGSRGGLDFRLSEGQDVICLGSVNVYERDGKYQLYANQILLDGLGALYEKYEQLKKKLDAEGLFSSAHKKPLPLYARKVGIVTASTGAAIQDIINIASRRNPYAQLILYPAKVQGEGAGETIIRGIRTLDEMGLDVIIVGRGGGSIEDLWAFNEEGVARAIYQCKTPIVSAVGHETDTTIADFVSDLRAPTPSAAAELTVVNIVDLMYTIKEQELRLNRLMARQVELARNELDKRKICLQAKSPINQIYQSRQRSADLEEKLRNRMFQVLQNKKHELQIYIEKMKGLSPLEKLSSGYAFVADEDGNTIRETSQVKQGEDLCISLLDGDIYATVKETKSRRR